MTTTTTELDESTELANATTIASSTMEMVKSITIDSDDMLDIAANELRDIVTRRKTIEAKRMDLTRPLDESKKRIIELFRGPIDELTAAESLLRRGVLTYQTEQQRLADEARRKAEAEARERQRIAQEAARKAAEAAQAARANDDAEAAAKAQAVADDAQMAADIQSLAPVQQPTITPAKSAGISTKKVWKGGVTDLAALVVACAKRLEAGDDFLLAFLAADAAAVNKAAVAMQDKLRVPGVRVWQEDQLSVRRK